MFKIQALVLIAAASLSLSAYAVEPLNKGFEPVINEMDLGMQNVEWHAPTVQQASVSNVDDHDNYQSDLGVENYSWKAPVKVVTK